MPCRTIASKRALCPGLFSPFGLLLLEPVLALDEAGNYHGCHSVAGGIYAGSGRIHQRADGGDYGEGDAHLFGEEQGYYDHLPYEAAAGHAGHGYSGEYGYHQGGHIGSYAVKGHSEEAEEEAVRMLNVYSEFAEKYMAVPVVKGVKSANERFAGALNTYTIEAMMQDGKALQSGTSHFLGQNFAKAFDVQFVNKENKLEYVWATSWGVSTRLMGALIMTHSDDNGLVLPPHLAPIQVVIVPIYKNAEMLAKIDEKVAGIVAKLKAMGMSVKYDNADNKRPGFKFADYEVKGVPVRLVMGGRDLENNTMEVMRRDTLEKETRSCDGIEEYVKDLLEEIQANIYKKALDYRNSRITTVDSYDEFKEKIEEGGFILAHWDGTAETEEKIKEETKATIRCIPFDSFVPGDKEPGKCMVTGKPSACRVIFARSY